MGLKINSITTEYGYEYDNVYCCITEVTLNTIENKISFVIEPFASKLAKEQGYKPLPIGSLDLAGYFTNDNYTDLIAASYDFIKSNVSKLEETGLEESYRLSLEADPLYEKIIKWAPFIGAEDI